MTIDEARKVARIVSQADGGCEGCVKQLMEMLNEAFPGFVWSWPDYDWYERPETRSLAVAPRATCDHVWVRPTATPLEYATDVRQVAIRCAKCGFAPGVGYLNSPDAAS